MWFPGRQVCWHNGPAGPAIHDVISKSELSYFRLLADCYFLCNSSSCTGLWAWVGCIVALLLTLSSISLSQSPEVRWAAVQAVALLLNMVGK